MARHLKQYPKQPLPLVYPFIVYSGDQPWNKPLELFTLFGEQAKLAKKWFNHPVQLLDLQKLPDDQIKQHAWSGLVEFTLKHSKSDFEVLLSQVLPWVHSIEETGSDGFSLATAVVKYLLNGVDVQKVELFRKKILEIGGDLMPTLAQLLKQEGMLEGIQKGMLEGIQEGRQKGMLEGIQQGIQKGRLEGIQEGELQGQAKIFLHLLKRRFRTVPSRYLVQIEQANAQSLFHWSEKILEAETIEEIFT